MAGGAKKIFEKFFQCATFASSSRNPSQEPPPPQQQPRIPLGFLCPVTSLLMFGPVIIDSGYSLDVNSLKACRDLDFTPPHLRSLPPPSFPRIPNRNLDTAIREWCHTYGHPIPIFISHESACHFVRGIRSMSTPSPPLLPFTFDPEEEEMILDNLQEDSDPASKESELVSLLTKETPLCSPRILDALITLLQTNGGLLRTLAGQVIFHLSLEPYNGAHILRSGAIAHLIALLNTSDIHASAQAAVTLRKLAQDGPFFSLTVGALGAVKPLLDMFCNNLLDENGRKKGGLALYHLLLNCQVNVEVLVEKEGVLKLIGAAEIETLSRDLREEALVILDCLVVVESGRKELMEIGNVKKLLKLVKGGAGVSVQSLNVMYNVCRRGNSGRFGEVVRAAGGEEVLAEEMEDWGVYGKEMADGMLTVIRRV